MKFVKINLNEFTLGISRLWKQADDDENRLLTLPEFQKMVIDHNIRITKDEATQLFREFDIDQTGTLDYDEFLAKLTVYRLDKLQFTKI